MATHATPGKVIFSVSVPDGSVNVRAEETEKTTIEVTPRNEAAEELMDRVREDVNQKGDRYDVLLDIPDRGKRWGFLGSSPKFDIRVVLPRGAELRIETVSADIVASGDFDDAHLHSTSGEVRLEGSAEAADLKTVSGDIYARSIEGDARIQTVSGEAEANEVNGPLVLKSVSGELNVASASSHVRGTSVSGDITVGAARGGSLVIKTTSGDIDIGVVPGTSVWMDVSSLSGSTTSELEPSDAADDGRSIEVRASSLSGDVTLKRAAASA
jgi:DUF4097 and DUF4098 domain-containing protein YvlB